MKTILLSIFKEYAEKIIDGEKRFEFRKRIPQKKISHIVFHTTSPDSKIVCIAEVNNIIADSPQKLWDKTAPFSGVKREFFFSYFKNSEIAYAYEIKNVYKIKRSLTLQDPQIRLTAPQSFKYLSENVITYIKKAAELKPIVSPYTIFLTGVHGVGKTFFADNYLSKFGFYTVTASSLIKKGLGDVPISKKVKKLVDNQEILINEFFNERRGKLKIVLDGHLLLVKNNNKIQKIPINIIERLNLSHIILLENSVEEICARILKRDSERFSKKLCKKMLQSERAYAIEISNKLKIPLTIIPNSSNIMLP